MIQCPSCGRDNPHDARFCNRCGADLAPAAAPRQERKVVSVVFADLVGSTAIGERSDPEDVRAMLAAYYERVRAQLERFGGTVEKFIGDAVVAVFGAPIVHEDDPERAVRAALAIRDAALADGIELRVAVNTGMALVEIDARPSEGQGMVTGDVMNTAARLQAAAPVNGVVVGEPTYRATSHVIEYQAAEPVQAKGKVDPVPVWEAVGPRQRLGSDVEPTPLSPMVGRDREIEALRAAVARARQEREPQLVTIVGVPGMGKSRLVAELLTVADADAELINWRQGRCLPYGDGVSYWALGEMVKAQAGILDSDSADEATAKITDAVASLIPDKEEEAGVAGHLRPLVGLSSDASIGGAARGEAFAAWRRLFEGMGEQRPTVLAFEDLHWADDGLLEFIDGLVDRASGVPLTVLCSARPELLARRPGWGGGKANATTLTLSALSDDETAQLISGRMDSAVLPAELQAALLDRAEGNPLFAEEYIRMLRDHGHLRLEGDTWRVDVADVPLPDTVQGIIAARLDALTVDEKAVLQTAAVIGKVFWLGSVAAVAEATRVDTEERLHALERKELVRRDRRASVAGESEYAVRHALVRDVAYDQIPRARRAELHVRTARWIESLSKDRADDHAEMRAHHYMAALELMRATGTDTSPIEASARVALRDAGRRADALSALEAAADFYRKAHDVWPQDDPAYPRLLYELGTALFWADNEGGEQLQEAAERMLAAGDPEGAAGAESRLAYLAWRHGSGEEAWARTQRSLQLIAGLPESRTTALIRAYAWRIQYLQGKHPSMEEGERILAVTEELGTIEDVLNIGITLITGRAATTEDIARAIGELEAMIEDALRANSHLAARAYINLGYFHSQLGDLGSARQDYSAGMEVARRFTSQPWVHWHGSSLVEIDFYTGEWEAAKANAERLLEAGGATYVHGPLITCLANLAAARGDRRTAEIHTAELVTWAADVGDPQVVHPSFAVAARLALDGGDRKRAADHLARSLDAVADSLLNISPESVDAAVVAEALGMREALLGATGKFRRQTPWVEAGALVIEGRFDDAGDLLEDHEDHAHAALVRLVGAERNGGATAGLAKAIEFYRRVGATGMLDRAAAVGVEASLGEGPLTR